jgi:Tol biopolymer transport system component/mono/diheme cytochrome c family protein
MRSWHVFALIAVLIAVLALAGWLLGNSAVRAPSNAIAQTKAIDNLRITIQLDQAALGPRVVDVALQDAAGKPLDGCAVRLGFSMAEMDMGTVEAVAQPVSQGHFQARGSFFTMAGRWKVASQLACAGQPARQASFEFPIAAPGEVSGPLNPLKPDAQTILAGQKLYLANCATCHGTSGKGDGPVAAGLSPRPIDFTQHMLPGRHTDGQISLWIASGIPGTSMPAWGQRFTEAQIWQLVTYLRTFGQVVAAAPTSPAPHTTAQPSPTPTPAVATVQEALPPIIFARQGGIWRSDGRGGPPQPITTLDQSSYAQTPTFSPDGSQVAFIAIMQPPISATVPLPTSALYVMNADGSALRNVWNPAQGLISSPTWAPDGRALYVATNDVRFASDPQNNNRLLKIVRVDLATGAQQPLLDDVLDPTIARDGSSMAYLKLSKDGYQMSLMVAALDGSGARELIGAAAFQGFYAPRFSPDGKRIVVAAIGGPDTDQQGIPLNPSGASPLQRLLGLLAPPAAEAHGLPWDLWSVNIDGSGLRRLTTFNEDLPMAAFSPDGQQIAVMAAGGIYMMQSDGAQLRRIDPLGDHGGLDWARR